MEFNKETALLQAEFRKFAKDVIAPKVDDHDKKGEVPREFILKLSEMGMLGALVPESCGGVALDTLGTVVALEEISKVCPSTGLILAVHNGLFAYPIVKFGTDAQRSKYLPQACGGEVVGGFAEMAANELLVAAATGSSQYTISGQNQLLLNGELNGPFVLSIPLPGSDASTFSIIDPGCPGVKITKNTTIIGMKASGIADVRFQDALVNSGAILGVDRQGQEITADVRNIVRLLFASIALGISQGAYENALKYAKERVQFGEPIANFGMVREMLADMAVKIESVRLLTYDAALARDAQKDFSKAAAIAHLVAAQSVADITNNAIQIYGGYGYMKDYPVERYFRDAQVIRVLCGTSRLDKEFIAAKII
ncbi:MAG TPA: acyl-CoA dehydrogenase family protein [bacterium]